jgi:hypothetical protein
MYNFQHAPKNEVDPADEADYPSVFYVHTYVEVNVFCP